MKTAVTFRLDPKLVVSARRQAHAENRSLTNFLETVLKKEFERRLRMLVSTREAGGSESSSPEQNENSGCVVGAVEYLPYAKQFKEFDKEGKRGSFRNSSDSVGEASGG